jgi:hypothetical protein
MRAAHVSSSGKDIAVLTAPGIFIWIPGFERLFHRETTLTDIATFLNFNTSRDGGGRDISVYLALGESNEKAAIATVSLPSTYGFLNAKPTTAQGSVCRISRP